ncbi:MAG: cell division protein FtsZ [Hyphomonadaceae bacterium]|nr:cell division protein FtsZ [Hyphomonadaceae bacterium]GIK48928.1 MAG: cell division protein FtsZ [Alphaproteobacteria bacterium]
MQELRPRIVVFGVGGAGGNAVNNMIDANLQGVEFVVANTDAQALTRARTPNRLQLGHSITEGLGAGARPEVGQAAAQESQPEIIEFLEGAHMVFVAAGMGGGTGTGAAPVIARTARERGILTIAVVTKPFHFEGQRRMQLAEAGVQELRKHVDTLIVIPNQNLFRVANERTTFAEAFQLADQVLYSGVRGVTDLMVMPGLINLDFADVRTVMAEMGTAMMGTGEAHGPNRSLTAAQSAMANPLLDIVSMRGAKGVLINITGGFDMTLYEVDQAANEIRAEVDPNANIILGSTFDESLEGSIRVSVVATGIDDEAIVSQQTVVEPARRAAEAPVRRPLATPRAEAPVEPVRETFERPRPSFANDADPAAAEPRRGGGFSLFGWKKPEPRAAEEALTPPLREFNLDDEPAPEINLDDEPAPSLPRRAHQDVVRDPALDEELEIPAFLRRQINPR